MKYSITINARKYEFNRLFFEREASLDFKTADMLLTVAGATLPAFGEAVVITKEIDGTTMTKWQGKVQKIRYLPAMKGTIEVIAFDYKHKISYLTPSILGYSSTKGSTAFVDLRDPNSATDLTAGTTDTADPVQDTMDFGKSDKSHFSRKDAMEIVEIISNRDIYVKRDGTADYVLGAGTDRSATHIIQVGDNGNAELDPEIGYIEDQSRKVLKVDVKGAGVGTFGYFTSSAQDGAYTSNDKVRQLSMPFLKSSATCDSAALNAIAELNRTVKYAKVTVLDLFKTNYDVFDTLKFKAKLPNKSVNENLKVYNLKTWVTPEGNQQVEKVELVLHNFGRSVWAKLLDPLKAAEANEGMDSISIGSTQVQDHIGLAGGASVVVEQANAGATGIVTSVESTLHTFTALAATKLAGAFLNIDFKIIVQKYGSGTGIMEVRIGDGTNHYPAGANRIFIQYRQFVGQLTYRTAAIYIPIELSGKTLTIKCRTQNGEVVAVAYPYLETIGEHRH